MMDLSAADAVERHLCTMPLYLPWEAPTPPKPSNKNTSRWLALATCWVHRRGVIAGWRAGDTLDGWQELYDLLTANTWDEVEAAHALALLARLDRICETLATLRISDERRELLWRALLGHDLRRKLPVTAAILLTGPHDATWPVAQQLTRAAWLPVDLRRPRQHPLVVEAAWPLAMYDHRAELFGAKKGSSPGGDKGLKGVLGRADQWGVVLIRDLHTLPLAEQHALAWAIEREHFMPVGADAPCPSPALIIATCPQAREIATPLANLLQHVPLDPHHHELPTNVAAAPADALEPTLEAMRAGEATARHILASYCQHLYAQLNTYDAVAARVGLDRRTVKKYIEQ